MKLHIVRFYRSKTRGGCVEELVDLDIYLHTKMHGDYHIKKLIQMMIEQKVIGLDYLIDCFEQPDTKIKEFC
jgi:hypothetical protein